MTTKFYFTLKICMYYFTLKNRDLLNLTLNIILSNICIFFVEDIMGKHFLTTGVAFGHVTYDF